jgi:PAS domain S-box-containing protein
MKVGEFTLLQKFSFLSLLCIMGITGAVCAAGARFFSQQLVRHDATVVADLSNLLVTRSIPESYFTESSVADAAAYERTVAQIVPTVGVVRTILYDAHARVLWSDVPRFIGRQFADNGELRKALDGSIQALIVRPGPGAEQEGRLEAFDRLEELYLPIRYARDGPIVGVLEIYRHPPALFAVLHRASVLVWILGGGGGLLLYVALFGVVRRAARRQLRLEAQLVAHARTLESRVTERTRELWTLYEASARLQATADLAHVVRAVAQGAQEVANARWARATHLAGGTVVADALVGSPPVPDAPAALEIPLVRRGVTVGALHLGAKADGAAFDEHDHRVLTTFAGHVATVLENTALFSEIKTTKEYLEQLFDNSADGIVAVDAGGRVTLFNHAGEELLGLRQKDMLGRRAVRYWARGPADFRRLRRLLVAKGHVKSEETELRGPGDRRAVVSISASLLWAASGRVSGAFAILRDITPMRTMQEQMIRTERLAATGLLAAGVAHEVGNPLACISSVSQLIVSRTVDPALRADLADILLNVERIERLLDDLTRVAQPGRIELRATSINVTVQHAVAVARHNVAVRGMTIETLLDPTEPTVTAVPDRLLQVFLNLIFNAVDAGGALTIRTVGDAAAVRVVFTDTGRGMSPDELKRAFDPFFSTKTATRHMGLGLFVSHEIIRQHGGTMLAESREGSGATFTVVLPRQS